MPVREHELEPMGIISLPRDHISLRSLPLGSEHEVSDHGRVHDESSRRRMVVTEPSLDDRRKRLWMVRGLKLVITIGFVALVVWGGTLVERTVRQLRSTLDSIPLSSACIGYIIIDFIRKLFPVLYIFIPLGSIFSLLLVDRLGSFVGAITYQALKLYEISLFFIYRRWYKTVASAILDGGEHFFSKAMPRDLRSVLQVFDNGWAKRFEDIGSKKQPLVVFSWGTCYYMDDFANLFWLATRSNVIAIGYIAGIVSARACSIPKVHLSMILILAATDVINDSGNFLDAMTSMTITSLPIWGIVIWSLTTAPATIYVHGTHLVLIYRALVNFWDKWRGEVGEREQGSMLAGPSTTAGTIDVTVVSPVMSSSGGDTGATLNASDSARAIQLEDSKRRLSMIQIQPLELKESQDDVLQAEIILPEDHDQESVVDVKAPEIKLGAGESDPRGTDVDIHADDHQPGPPQSYDLGQ